MILKKVTIYTDGACSGNPGPGGYGAVLLYSSYRKELSGGFRWTTNNRMELFALIVAIKSLKETCDVEIKSDSKYLLGAFKEKWLEKWKDNGWKTSSNGNVQNVDLWQKLDQLLSNHTARYIWVKGHSSDQENKRCDYLAVNATKQTNLNIDSEYEKINPYPFYT